MAVASYFFNKNRSSFSPAVRLCQEFSGQARGGISAHAGRRLVEQRLQIIRCQVCKLFPGLAKRLVEDAPFHGFFDKFGKVPSGMPLSDMKLRNELSVSFETITVQRVMFSFAIAILQSGS